MDGNSGTCDPERPRVAIHCQQRKHPHHGGRATLLIRSPATPRSSRYTTVAGGLRRDGTADHTLAVDRVVASGRSQSSKNEPLVNEDLKGTGRNRTKADAVRRPLDAAQAPSAAVSRASSAATTSKSAEGRTSRGRGRSILARRCCWRCGAFVGGHRTLRRDRSRRRSSEGASVTGGRGRATDYRPADRRKPAMKIRREARRSSSGRRSAPARGQGLPMSRDCRAESREHDERIRWERVPVARAAGDWDRLWLSIESPRAGDLDVIDREEYADGTSSEPFSYSPTTCARRRQQGRRRRLIRFRNRKRIGRYSSTPRRSRSDQTGERSTIVEPPAAEGPDAGAEPLKLATRHSHDWEARGSAVVERLR